MSRTVWQIDPVHLTPYYDAALCQALARAGWSVRLFTSPYLYDPALPSSSDYPVDYLYFRALSRRLRSHPYLRRHLRGLLYLLGHRALLRLLADAPPDIVHIQWSRLPQFDRWLMARMRRLGIPVVHTVHDVEPLFAHVREADLANVYRMADRLVVHADANKAALLKRYPQLYGEHVRVIRHIAPQWLIPPDADRAAARRCLGIPFEMPVFLFFGSVRPYKGLDVLIDAYAQARRVCPGLWLLIAGAQDRSCCMPCPGDQIVLRSEYIPSDQLWMYYLAADVAVLPYRRVTQSGALITAMNFGLPVIVSDVGALPETVDGNGWVVPPGDTTALAQALVESVCDLERLRRMGLRSRQLIAERHAPGLIAEQTIALYEEVLG